MIAINQDLVFFAYKNHKTEIDHFIHSTEKKIKSFRAKPTRTLKKKKVALLLTPLQEDYLDYLSANFKDIILGTPDDLLKFATHFETIIKAVDLGKESKPYIHRVFRDRLLCIMGYNSQRNKFYSKYFQGLGIKACVYCNSQLTISVKRQGLKNKALYQVDHYYPKSYYPCFSVSFFNLYPTCANCNLSKSNKPLKFVLYSNNPLLFSKSVFQFSISQISITNYRVNFEKEKLEIEFKGGNSKEMNKIFAVEQIYNTQKDVAEEILLKSIIYNDTYKRSLEKSFSKLYNKKDLNVQRLILGNYTLDTEIHNRPMSKFMMDIAKQLKLI
ncbi:HNH endonuclease family protein [Algoriphagus yeomjeoni]|uniref:HNH endonuclease n=1 Tax=Algoriphagus yeomjeoni TaxID=291403 RepID=A0A327P5Z3_9BACT|nr:HNH endonuclease domain-containing protein [Algoriphagus yeomjeoni]RAI86807.1 HNH endonuclease [Algoriphagus yeomjeoni]